MVEIMMESNLPCFVRGEETITRLREKFQLQLSDKKASEFMIEEMKRSYENFFTTAYDMFQKFQNNIPY